MDEGYNFVLNIILIKGFHDKLWASKVLGIPILGISKLPTWESLENDIKVQPPWLVTNNTIRRKVVACLKSRP
jgi:hypothetical protein